MAQKKQSEIINRLIAEVKLAVLQLNKNTAGLKGKQTALAQSALNILGGNVFTTVEKNKLASAITDLSGYTTTTALIQLLNNKQASLSQDQLAVVNGEVFTTAFKTGLEGLMTGGHFLGDIAIGANDDAEAEIVKVYGGAEGIVQDPNRNAGDHVEVIKPGANVGDLLYITYTYGTKPVVQGQPIKYGWNAGTEKVEHLKGGSIDAYSTAQADARFAPLADVSMDDASILALEAITITN